MLVSNSSSSLTEMASLMKHDRKWRRKTSEGPEYPSGNFARVHPLWRRKTCSARQRKYGIQPMSPSVSEKRSVGNRSHIVAQISSTIEKIDMTDDSVIATLAGASGLVIEPAERDADPMCRQRTVPSSH